MLEARPLWTQNKGFVTLVSIILFIKKGVNYTVYNFNNESRSLGICYTQYKVIPVGIKVVAEDSARLTTLGGSEWLVKNGEAPVGLTVANSTVLLVPTPDWEWVCDVRGFGSPGNSVMEWDWFLIKPLHGEGTWAVESVLLCVGEDPFPASNIIAWAWVEK